MKLENKQKQSDSKKFVHLLRSVFDQLRSVDLGFTLIELLVTITIIGLLTSIGVFSYQSTNRKARDGKRIADLEQIRTALEIYRSDKREYPPDLDTLEVEDYIQSLPEDPKPTDFGYEYVPDPANPTDPRTYELCAHLEQVADPDNDLYCGPGNNCGGSGGGKACNYAVTNP
ncbi:MAG: type II secretion system protein [Candidatus Chisholmbacteria bacterium]|nr:type II secretion system protein [Candidatus Chisholmbacteria bacterium]